MSITENLGAARVAAEQRRHRHRWGHTYLFDGMRVPGTYCACGAIQDPAKSRRGKTARRRGNDYEREVASLLSSVMPDIKRTGMYGGPDDVAGRLLYIQCKKQAGLYPRGAEALLKDTETHANADQYTAVAYAHPGHGHKKLIVMDLADFVNLLREVMTDA